MTTADKPKLVIKWAWRYGVLGAEGYDTVDDAIEAAVWASGAGKESFAAIEVVYPDGRTEVLDDVGERMRVVEDREEQERKGHPVSTRRIDLRSPSGEWALYRDFVDPADAERDAADLAKTFGAERVRVRTLGGAAVHPRSTNEA